MGWGAAWLSLLVFFFLFFKKKGVGIMLVSGHGVLSKPRNIALSGTALHWVYRSISAKKLY